MHAASDMRKTVVSLLVLVMVCLSISACRDESFQDTPDSGIDASDDAAAPEGNTTDRYLLCPNPDEEVTVTERLSLSAMVLRAAPDPEGGYTFEPVTGATVRFNIEEETVPESDYDRARLMSASVFTDDSGKASVDLMAGSAPTDLVVRVRADGATNECEINVRVIERPIGHIKAVVQYDGPVPLSKVDLYLMDGSRSRCPYNPSWVPMNEEASASVRQSGDAVVFGPFHESPPNGPPAEYPIWARAKIRVNDLETIGAGGCVDGITIRGGETVVVSVPLMLARLSVVGRYDMVSHYNWTTAIPGTVGEVMRRLDQAFNDTGNFLVDMVQLFLDEYLSDVIEFVAEVVSWVLEQFQPLIAAWINDWVQHDAPAWLQHFLTIGQDIMQVASNLEVLSRITFDKGGNRFRFNGQEVWKGVALYWRVDCEQDAPPDCGRYEISIEPDSPLGLILADFEAEVDSFNKLRILEHGIELRYGRLILFVLNELILPRIADGAHSLEEALVHAVDCSHLADSVERSDGEDDDIWGVELPDDRRVGVSQESLRNVCISALESLGGYVTDLLEGLVVDSMVTRTGQWNIYEDNNDLLVDRLEKGIWEGRVIVDGTAGDPFRADSQGVRVVP